MNNFSSEPFQWVEIFWRRDLHKCNRQVTFLIQLKRNALVKYWLTHHQNHVNYGGYQLDEYLFLREWFQLYSNCILDGLFRYNEH